MFEIKRPHKLNRQRAQETLPELFRPDFNCYPVHHPQLKQAVRVPLLPIEATHVLDATAGFLKDAMTLTRMGFQVTACERNPQVHSTLQPLLQQKPVARLRFIPEDTRTHLAHLRSTSDFRYQVIYLDPMFPPNPKQAQVKKPLQLLRQWVGEDLDATELFMVALQEAEYRVVVKRSRHGAEIHAAIPPHHSLLGVRNRYDIYMPCR